MKHSFYLLLAICLVHAQTNTLAGTAPPAPPTVPRTVLTPTSANGSSTASYGSSSLLTCNQDCGWNTIEVNGAGTLNVSPDVANLNVQVTGSAKTTNEAITILSQKITTVLDTLTNQGLNSSNWKTNYLSVYPNTSYVNGSTITYGQIASQSMTITVPIPNANGTAVGKIYDGLAKVKDISINGLTFDLQNKTTAYANARKLAYQDALKRASDYTSAAGVAIGAPLTITDSFSSAPVVAVAPMAKSMALMASDSVPTTVSVGTVTINYYVDVVFSFA